MRAASPPLVEDPDAASKLVAFMGELTEPLLADRERYEFLVLFSLLIRFPRCALRSADHLADKLTPQFEGSRETLDRLFEMHLRGAPDSSRFRVWFGAGAAPDSPRVGMLYFNAEWLSAADVVNILAPHVRPLPFGCVQLEKFASA